MTVACPFCLSKSHKYLDEYKHLMPEDSNYLGKMAIYQCGDCKLSFAYPFPDLKKLDEYYKNVYRQPHRPHYLKNPENIAPGLWHQAQYSYISQFVDFSKIKSVLDLGPGYGFLLREIRAHHPKIKLAASDPDSESLAYLTKYNIAIKDSFENEKFDLIISSHSLEHMTSLNLFFTHAQSLLAKNGKMFIEVPNCPFVAEGYLNRPYDGPHLFFFTLESLKNILLNFNFKIDHISSANSDFPTVFKLMEEQYQNLNQNIDKIENILSKFKALIPESLKNNLKMVFGRKNNISILSDPFLYGGQRWTIRSVISYE